MPEFLKVNDVLEYLDLHDTMQVAEFGCGSAVFTVALAKHVPKGKVYGLDIQEEKLSALKGRITKEGLTNITTVLCDLEAANGSTLPENSLDIVLIPNVLFQAENTPAMMQEAKRILKKGGQLLVVDWLKKTDFSPKEDLVVPEKIKKIAEDMQLSLK